MAPERPVSASSRFFREQVLTASIWSILRGDGTRPGQHDTPFAGEEIRNVQAVHGPESEHQPSLKHKTDPFAGRADGGIEYKTMIWWHAGMVMVAETISLGILSLPMALSTLGIIPGLVLLLGLGAMATYSGYVIGQFRIAYPHIHSWADAGEVLLGTVGREVFGTGQLLFLIFVMGSHILTFAVMMNAITEHATCTIVFMVVGTVVSLIFTLPRTLKNLSYYSIASFVSIIAAVLITMIDVGVNRPGRHINTTNSGWTQDVRLWPSPDVGFHTAFLAMTNIVFAYAGHVAFFSFISELKNANDFPKALAFLQISDISMYIVTAVVIYYYTGNSVTSPALNSASPVVRKITYGVAILTIVIAGVVNGHVAVKYLYIRLLRNCKEDILHQRSVRSIGLWVLLCITTWSSAWLIAETIPVFNDLLAITSALFASWFTYGLSGIFWFYLNFERGSKWWQVKSVESWTWKKSVALIANCLLLASGMVICIVGIYASTKSVALKTHEKRPFSCGDTSGL